MGPGPGADADYHRKWLSSNVRFQASWEKSAYEKLGRGMEISTEAAAVLMNIYWTWQAPLHNWVYRPCKHTPPEQIHLFILIDSFFLTRLFPRHGPWGPLLLSLSP